MRCARVSTRGCEVLLSLHRRASGFLLPHAPQPRCGTAAMSSSNRTFHREPRVTATPAPDVFPELLDDAQWTQAATFAQGDKYTGPSERIGRYYRQRLDELDEEGLERKRAERTAPPSPLRPTIERKGWAAGLPCRPLMLSPVDVSEDVAGSSTDLGGTALGLLKRQRDAKLQDEADPHAGTKRSAHITEPVAIEERMAAYVHAGIDPASLAPFNDAWMESAMEQVPTELNGVEPGEVEVMVGDMINEVHGDYFDAVKLSMVEYVLKSEVEGRRLEITEPTQKFELQTFHPSQDPSVAECAAPKVRHTRNTRTPPPLFTAFHCHASSMDCSQTPKTHPLRSPMRATCRHTTPWHSAPGTTPCSMASSRWSVPSSSTMMACSTCSSCGQTMSR